MGLCFCGTLFGLDEDWLELFDGQFTNLGAIVGA